MSKKYKKTANPKSKYVIDRLNHKRIYCVTNKWIKWAKRYLNKAVRRKHDLRVLDICANNYCETCSLSKKGKDELPVCIALKDKEV